MARTLTPDEIGTFLARPLVATLATYRANGSVLLSPVWHEWDGSAFNIVIGKGDVKARHLTSDARASVAVYENDPPYCGVEVLGATRVLADDAHVLTRRLAIRYLGEALGEQYASSNADDPQLWIRVEPVHLRSWDYKDLWP